MDKEVTLTSEQLNLLEQFLPGFLSYTQSDEFKKHMEEIEEKKKFFQKELPLKLNQLTEPDLERIVEMLWAFSSTWTNTSYIANKIIDENGLNKLIDYLKKIYEFKDTPEDAYELFVTSVKRWGPAAITELLAYIYPDKCGIWNTKVRKALEILQIESVPTKKYKISKEEYKTFNKILKIIKSELEKHLGKDIDFLVFADVFLYYIVEYYKTEPFKRPKEILEFDHDEIRDLIERIGNILGFDTEIEVNIAPGARIDVIWKAKIGNLGQVKYVFEVHRSGSIDSLILNLQKVLNDPHVQKVIAVSDSHNLKQIEKECEGLPEQFRKVLKLWDVTDVLKTAESLEDAISRIRKLGF
jgi:hypothetical protein